MQRNVGKFDSLIRIVVGLALLLGFFISPASEYRWLFLLGVVPLATGLMRSCVLYRLLGINTNR